MPRLDELFLVDEKLEWALASEAVFEFERYQALGARPSDYAVDGPRSIVEAAERLGTTPGSRVDFESVSLALERAGRLATLGGLDGLKAALGSDVEVPADAEKLRELSRLRALRSAALRVVALTERRQLHPALEALTSASEAIEGADEDDIIGVRELTYGIVESIVQGTRADRLVHPGLEYFERAMGKLSLDSMVVLGAATNTGKSFVTLAMCMEAAKRDVTCGYISCEDPSDIVGSRVLGNMSGVSSRRILQGDLDERAMRRIMAAVERPLAEIDGKILFSFKKARRNEADVCATMSRMARKGAKLVVVDYIQNIDSTRRQQDRRNEIRWLSAAIKAHAQRLGVALVLISQFSRPEKGNSNVEPSMYDLKEAGDLENAAEFIVLIWRDAHSDYAPLHFKLAKSKIGGVGARWQMARDPETGRLVESPGTYEPPKFA